MKGFPSFRSSSSALQSCRLTRAVSRKNSCNTNCTRTHPTSQCVAKFQLLPSFLSLLLLDFHFFSTPSPSGTISKPELHETNGKLAPGNCSHALAHKTVSSDQLHHSFLQEGKRHRMVTKTFTKIQDASG